MQNFNNKREHKLSTLVVSLGVFKLFIEINNAGHKSTHI